MSIYATNRTGRMSTATAVANESYGSNDVGRILYESQLNDQAIFEAAVASDFREIRGRYEGTLLESEIEALSEASTKGFFTRMKERLAAFWEKVKGVFKSVINKIALFVAGDGKRFVKQFEEVYKKKGPFTGTIENVMIPTPEALEIDLPNPSKIESDIKAQKNAEKIDKSEVIGKALADAIGGGAALTPEDFKKKVKETSFKKDVTINKGNVDKYIKGMLNAVETGHKEIKALKEAEKRIEKSISDVGSKIKQAERDALGDHASKEDKKNTDNVVRNISALVSAYENATGVVMGTMIAIVKVNLKNSYSILNRIMHSINKTAKNESAAILAEDAVEEVLDSDETEIPEESQDAVEEIIAAAEDSSDFED